MLAVPTRSALFGQERNGAKRVFWQGEHALQGVKSGEKCSHGETCYDKP